jgi:ElaA protein
MSLQWKIKPFEELSVHELYDLLRLRSEIFVVEQNCVYLDLDGKDKVATLIGIWWENSGARSSI